MLHEWSKPILFLSDNKCPEKTFSVSHENKQRFLQFVEMMTIIPLCDFKELSIYLTIISWFRENVTGVEDFHQTNDRRKKLLPPFILLTIGLTSTDKTVFVVLKSNLATIFEKVFWSEKFPKTEYFPPKRIISPLSRTCKFSSRTCNYKYCAMSHYI